MSRLWIVGAAWLALCAPATAQNNFLAEADDIPLAPGLEETVFGAAFAGADGRLLETTAAGEGSAAAVRAFYLAAMPPLGWSLAPGEEGPLLFQRGREQLLIAIDSEGPRVTARYRLTIRGAAMALD
ncbi:MAG: hypothetical protein AB7L65_01435 [Hyphomonadaceae bacterium]